MNASFFEVAVFSRKKLRYVVELSEFEAMAEFTIECRPYRCKQFFDCEIVITHRLVCGNKEQGRVMTSFKANSMDTIMMMLLAHSPKIRSA